LSKNNTPPEKNEMEMISGQDVIMQPLHERKAILQDRINEQPHLFLVRSVPGEQAKDFFALVSQQNLDGIVIKKKDSSYQVGTDRMIGSR
jgi:DNA ligase 1